LLSVRTVDTWFRIALPGSPEPLLWFPTWACDDQRFSPLERHFLYVGFRLCTGPAPPQDALFIGSVRGLAKRFGLSEPVFRLIRDRLVAKGVLLVDSLGHGLDAYHLIGPR
jgi:hypothetical protein